MSETTIYQDGHWELHLNGNYPPEEANSFLMYGSICVGGSDPVRKFGGKEIIIEAWRAGLADQLHIDEKTGEESDWLELGTFPTQEEANQAVWDNRYLAYCHKEPMEAISA